MTFVALAQLNSSDNIEQNYLQVEQQVWAAQNLKPKPKILFFPENTLYFRINNADVVRTVNTEHPVMKKIEALAINSGMFLHLTTAFDVQGKVFNSSILISPEGKSEVLYNKIHLFDVTIPGQAPIAESKVFSRGESSRIFSVGEMNIGSSICYDIRFSELYGIYAKMGVHAIVVPSAFLVRTGQAHWMTLLKARAIESQCFVIAAAQAGLHKSTLFPNEFRETFGHSVVFDPWGDQLVLKETGTGLITAEIDITRCENVRKSIPMASHRRL